MPSPIYSIYKTAHLHTSVQSSLAILIPIHAVIRSVSVWPCCLNEWPANQSTDHFHISVTKTGSWEILEVNRRLGNGHVYRTQNYTDVKSGGGEKDKKNVVFVSFYFADVGIHTFLAYFNTILIHSIIWFLKFWQNQWGRKCLALVRFWCSLLKPSGELR